MKRDQSEREASEPTLSRVKKKKNKGQRKRSPGCLDVNQKKLLEKWLRDALSELNKTCKLNKAFARE